MVECVSNYSRLEVATVGCAGNTGNQTFMMHSADMQTVMGNRFQQETVILENKDILRDDWQPDEIIEREDEIDEYAAVLQPVIRGWQPSNVFLYGVTGTGKTISTRELMGELLVAAGEKDDIRLNIVDLNCNSLNSSYQVAVNLVNEIRAPSHRLTSVQLSKPSLSETGYPQKRIFNELYDDIEQIGGTVVFVLDEIDNIGSDDDILYELPRARSTHDIDAKVGVVGISNNFAFRDELSSKVKDTLCEEEVLFSPYETADLQSILRQRVERAFTSSDVLTDDVIPLCAALAAADSGSARQAISLLRKAADIAESKIRAETRSDHVITETDVREARQAIQKQQVIEGMYSLTLHGKYVLFTVCEMAAKEETPARTKSIYRRYRKVARRFNSDPLKRRRIHDHLSDLTLSEILGIVEQTAGRGNYNLYELNVPLASALEALVGAFGEDDVEPLRSYAERTGVIEDW